MLLQLSLVVAGQYCTAPSSTIRHLRSPTCYCFHSHTTDAADHLTENWRTSLRGGLTKSVKVRPHQARRIRMSVHAHTLQQACST